MAIERTVAHLIAQEIHDSVQHEHKEIRQSEYGDSFIVTNRERQVSIYRILGQTCFQLLSYNGTGWRVRDKGYVPLEDEQDFASVIEKCKAWIN